MRRLDVTEREDHVGQRHGFHVGLRAGAELAIGNGLEVGLHLNFSESFTDEGVRKALEIAIIGLSVSETKQYAQILYNPSLRNEFAHSYSAQAEEFLRLFGELPRTLTDIITCTFAPISYSVT